jgi:hypothetical protein
LSSAGLQVFFRVNRQDASLLAKEVFHYSGYEVKSQGTNRPVYWSYAEEWEHKTAGLQNLPPRSCYAKHKIEGGWAELYTVDVDPPWDILDIHEERYMEFLDRIPFGLNYLCARKDLAQEAGERQKRIAEIAKKALSEPPPIEQESPVQPLELTEQQDEKPEVVNRPSIVATPRERKAAVIVPNEVALQQLPPESEPKAEREHRRLQHLVKRLAEQSGYRAILEASTSDSQGRVDVSLESDVRRIACEICVTTSPEHELANIRKCLVSGYDTIILCSSDRKALMKIKALASHELTDEDMRKVVFLEPGALAIFFEEEAARSASTVGKVKGYKVKVNYQPLNESEKKSKREAIAQVVLQSLRREQQK